jgi:hypothetical protein
MPHYLVEALVVGVITVIIGLAVSGAIIGVKRATVPAYTAWGWMTLGLFLTGFVAHVLLEALRVNAWYCTHGHACRTE